MTCITADVDDMQTPTALVQEALPVFSCVRNFISLLERVFEGQESRLRVSAYVNQHRTSRGTEDPGHGSTSSLGRVYMPSFGLRDPLSPAIFSGYAA